MKKIRIAVADDQPIYRNGLVSLLNSMPDFKVVLEAGSGIELIKGLKTIRANVAIIDYRMPELNGINTVKIIREKNHELRILMLSMYDDEEFVENALKNGVNGYLSKDDEPDEIKLAIESLMNTGYYVNDRTKKVMIKKLMVMGQLRPEFILDQNDDFSENEIEVMRLIAQERSNKEIADIMNKAERTIEGYRRMILEKTGAKNSIGIVMYGIKNGLIDL